MKNVENVEAVEVTETEDIKESKIKTAASKVGAAIKKHWKKVAVGAAAVTIALIGYNEMRKKNQTLEDETEDFETDGPDDVVIDIDIDDSDVEE